MSKPVNKEERKNVVISISGMNCNHCAKRVEDSLNKVPGVVEAKVSFNEQKAIIKYNPEEVETGKLKDSIRSTGYKVVE